jgi:hypothetical protein
MTTEANELEAVKAGAVVMYTALNSIYALHEISELVEGSVCRHCSKIADGNVAYPCPTVQILFNDFIGEED